MDKKIESSDFRSADMIELHSSSIVLFRKDYPDAVVGWREYPDQGPILSVDGETLQRLCDHLGIKTHARHTESVGRDGKSRAWRESLDSYEFPLVQHNPHIVGAYNEPDLWIEELSARIVAPDLLEMIVKRGFRDSDGQVDYWTVNVTYCGKFTVWWTQPEP